MGAAVDAAAAVTTVVPLDLERARQASAAAAVWAPPGVEKGANAKLRGCGRDLPRIVVHTPVRTIPAMVRFARMVRTRRKVHVPRPHWHVTALGVEPAHQGQGLGTLLVQEGLDLADADRAPAYLEAETEANVRFYRLLRCRRPVGLQRRTGAGRATRRRPHPRRHERKGGDRLPCGSRTSTS